MELIESIIFPETDHSLCLNCQVGKGNPHLCSSCQWYASGHLVEMSNQRLVDQKLDEIQNEIPLDVTTNSVLTSLNSFLKAIASPENPTQSTLAFCSGLGQSIKSRSRFFLYRLTV